MPHRLVTARVVDLSRNIAGPYATKLLADAGADVVKIEPRAGDPLRRWSASGARPPDADGVLFEFLHFDKRAVIGTLDDDRVRDLVAGADAVVEDGALSQRDIDELRATSPALVVVSISPFGRSGPWATRPATEFTLQAECGGTISRGAPDQEPLATGGRLGEWITGAYAAIALLGALRDGRQSGRGEHVDVSMLECMCERMGGLGPSSRTLGGVVRDGVVRSLELPSIEPTRDGFVGLCTITGQQFRDLLTMIGRDDLHDDDDLASFPGRWARRDEFRALVRAWTSRRTTAEVVELASLLRIPVAPLATPDNVADLDHFVARRVFVRAPGGAFSVPRVPYQVDGNPAIPERPAPDLGADGDSPEWRAPARGAAADRSPSSGRPLRDLRVLDLTAFWAGPSATAMLGMLGADVIHVESTTRPDGYRFNRLAGGPAPDEWWEHSAAFHTMNTNKRGITLDLRDDEGRELFFRLAARADVLVENFAPRVLDNLSITVDALHERNPALVIVRMPAFGLSGPWRDRTGMAPTIETASGLAWLTGYRDGLPVTLRGPCDGIAGMHAAIATLAAVHERDASGLGHVVEVSMVEAALNVGAEMIIEYSAYGACLHRAGNRGPGAAPQGVYACRGDDQWVALAVSTDDEWSALRSALDDPDWARTPAFATAAGRHTAHDVIDAHLAAWARGRSVADAVDALVGAGVPAAAVVDGLDLAGNPQLRARGFYQPVKSERLGQHEFAGLPFRFAGRAEPWIRAPGPTLGQHTREVLGELLGLEPAVLDALEVRGVIGTRPVGL